MPLLGTSCLSSGPAGLAGSSDNVGEQVSADQPRCHSGTLECADGATVTPCGTWYFDVNESGAVSGGGEITSGVAAVPVELTLSGIIDEGADSYDIVLTSGNGSGQMTLSYPGPTLDLAGSWSFTDAPEPAGVEVSGGAAGVSCVALP